MKPESQHTVSFQRSDDSRIDGCVSIYEEDDRIRFVLELGSETFSAVADDCFGAFCEIRKELEARDTYPRCLGATRNVFPSGMSRSMGAGVMAYRLTMGSQALRGDLVNIFDDANGSPSATVEEQERFFDEWITSLGN